jgi:hypothetical protein
MSYCTCKLDIIGFNKVTLILALGNSGSSPVNKTTVPGNGGLLLGDKLLNLENSAISCFERGGEGTNPLFPAIIEKGFFLDTPAPVGYSVTED